MGAEVYRATFIVLGMRRMCMETGKAFWRERRALEKFNMNVFMAFQVYGFVAKTQGTVGFGETGPEKDFTWPLKGSGVVWSEMEKSGLLTTEQNT